LRQLAVRLLIVIYYYLSMFMLSYYGLAVIIMSGWNDAFGFVHMIFFLMFIVIELKKNISKKKVSNYLRIIPVAVLVMPVFYEFFFGLFLSLPNLDLEDAIRILFLLVSYTGVILGIAKDASFRNLKGIHLSQKVS
jgi:hypothetical protein